MSPEAYKKDLEDINQQIQEAEIKKTVLRRHHSIAIELIVIYSKLLYLFVAFVFFFSTLPSSFIEYILFCGPIISFHVLVCALKAAVKWYYESEINRNFDKVKELKFKKKTILAKVKEKIQYKEATEIIQKYGSETAVVVRQTSRSKSLNTFSEKIKEQTKSFLNVIFGEKKKNSLICTNCQWHNGMALEEEYEYIGFRCCHCLYLNLPRKRTSLQNTK